MDIEGNRLVASLRRFTVCQLIDALGSSWPVETAICPVDPQFRICGPAMTIECAPDDNLTVHHALHLAQPGDVLVITSANSVVALWGELMSLSAHLKGLTGTIIDGSARDPLEIRSLAYPVFCRNIHPRKPRRKLYGRLNVPVRIGSVCVSPQDFVVADANGIICIPRAAAGDAVRAASEVQEKEKRIEEQIRSGRTTLDIFELDKYLPSNHNTTGCRPKTWPK